MEPDSRLDQLEQTVSNLKSDIAELRATRAASKTAWYKTPSIVISIIALVYSIGSSLLSNQRMNLQDINSKRAQFDLTIIRRF
jgi:hypothetical protein